MWGYFFKDGAIPAKKASTWCCVGGGQFILLFSSTIYLITVEAAVAGEAVGLVLTAFEFFEEMVTVGIYFNELSPSDCVVMASLTSDAV